METFSFATKSEASMKLIFLLALIFSLPAQAFISSASGNFSSEYYQSSACTTASTAITSGSWATFSTSPTLTFTAVNSGTFKIWASAPLQSLGSNAGSIAMIANTAGSATVLAQQQGPISSATTGVIGTLHLYMLATLVAGTSYSFTIQGYNAGGTSITLRCDDSGTGNVGTVIVAQRIN